MKQAGRAETLEVSPAERREHPSLEALGEPPKKVYPHPDAHGGRG